MLFRRVVVCAFLFLAARGLAEAKPGGRESMRFDKGWMFHKGDAPGAQKHAFDDSAWRVLDLPHDWSIEEKFHPGAAGGMRGGYVEIGTGWYRKRFDVPSTRRNGKVFIEFDGIYKDSDVWLNGKHLGKRWYGYVGFRYDLTPHIDWGGENIIAVRVNNAKQTCRWYSGSGIYRHVWLVYADKLSLAHWGTHVTTPTVSADSAVIHVDTLITNGYDTAKSCTLNTVILDPNNNSIADAKVESEVNSAATHRFHQEFTIKKPALWSADQPAIYSARTIVTSGGEVLDEYITPFGIRSIGWDSERGFIVNGKSVLLNGVNIHHDLGALGAAFNKRAMQRRLEVLKEMGCNSLRMAHNPPAQELLDLCDRMGFYVIDEAFDKWGSHRYETFEQDWQRDLLAMILRDRNHPCVILWSLGNENWAPKFNQRKTIYTQMTELARRHDSTRKFTYALSPGNFVADAKLMDVASLNYQEHKFDMYRQGASDMVIISAETYSYWRGKDNNGQAYYPMNPWLDAFNNPDVAGSYVWTGIDYLGEAKARWPYRGWNGSLIDTCAFRKPVSYLHESFWSDKPMVHIAVMSDALKTQKATVQHWGWPKMVSHWTLPELKDQKVKITTFSNCDEVELLINGKSLGRKKLADFEDRMISWDEVPYDQGRVRARGFKDEKEVCSHELKTAGPAARIELVADRDAISADGRDLGHVETRIVDASGVIVPNASHLVSFEISGPASLRAVDNGNLTSPEPYQGTSRSAFQGRCLAIVQAGLKPGTITLTASAEGLRPAKLTINAE